MQRTTLSMNKKTSGFTLIELSIVLLVVGLLLAMLMPSIGMQNDQRYYRETEQSMSDIREALIGYAASHSAADGKPYLPCPDTDNDGLENRNGADCDKKEGWVPWNTLGVGPLDGWNNRIRYRVTKKFSASDKGFTLTSPSDITICADDDCKTTLVSNIPVVLVSHGKNGLGAINEAGDKNTAPGNQGETINAEDNDQYFVSHTPSSTSGFDDIVVWLSPNILFNRMIAAGRLP